MTGPGHLARRVALALGLACVPAWAGAAEPLATAPVPLSPPRLLRFVPAELPEAARLSGREASVELELDVDATGRVTDARVVEAAGDGFDEAALAAARGFLFQPVQRGQEAIAAHVRYRYVFTRGAADDAPEGGELRAAGSGEPWLVPRLALGTLAADLLSDRRAPWRLARAPWLRSLPERGRFHRPFIPALASNGL